MKKFALLLTLIFCVSAFAQRNVAVLEIERRGVTTDEISREEAMGITGVIRGAAVRTLPHGQFSVMTSETVQAMGGAVLAECFDETCVIQLGRTIDAEYIMRGALSKFQREFTLTIEMFETEYGNLVATSALLRSENLVDILNISEFATVEMLETFLARHAPQSAVQTVAQTSTVRAERPARTPKVRTERERGNSFMSAGIQGAFRNNLGGGVQFNPPISNVIETPYGAVGFNAFFDINYIEIGIGMTYGSGEWTLLGDANIMSTNFGLLGKYPIDRGNVVVFPAIGINYQLGIDLELDGNDMDDESDFSRLWFQFGGGMDFSLNDAMFLRATVLYGIGLRNKFEDDLIGDFGGNGILSHGLDIRAGIGFRF